MGVTAYTGMHIYIVLFPCFSLEASVAYLGLRVGLRTCLVCLDYFGSMIPRYSMDTAEARHEYGWGTDFTHKK